MNNRDLAWLLKEKYGIDEEIFNVDITILDDEKMRPLFILFWEYNLESEFSFPLLRRFRQACSSSEEAAERLIDAGSLLYQAIYTKDAKVVRYMLKREFSSGSMILGFNITALHIAVVLEDVDIVRVLLEFGADVTALDSRGSSPSFYIYQYDKNHSPKKVEILKLLLAHSSSPVSVSQVKHTLKRGDAESVRVVLSNVDFTPKPRTFGVLYYLAVNSNSGITDVLKPYLHKCNVNEVCSQLTALFIASIHSNVQMVKFLLENGAEVNYRDPYSHRTALYCAFFESRYFPELEDRYDKCIEILLQNGADPQLNVEGDTTIFENMNEKLKAAIAQLAVLIDLGTPITKVTKEKLDSNCELKEYYKRCRQVLRKKINGNVTILKLLTGSQRVLEKYAGNRELLFKLDRISHNQKVRSCFPYYGNILTQRFSKAILRRRLTDASAGVLSKILENRVDNRHVIIERLSEYLSNEDLWLLCRV